MILIPLNELVGDTQKHVTSLRDWKLETLLDTNPLADWYDLHVVEEPGAKTYVGMAVQKDFSQPWLYASYCEFMNGTGNKPVAGKRFSNLLDDLIKNQLGIDGISKQRDRNSAYFPNLVLREHRHHDIPTAITQKTLEIPTSIPHSAPSTVTLQ